MGLLKGPLGWHPLAGTQKGRCAFRILACHHNTAQMASTHDLNHQVVRYHGLRYYQADVRLSSCSAWHSWVLAWGRRYNDSWVLAWAECLGPPPLRWAGTPRLGPRIWGCDDPLSPGSNTQALCFDPAGRTRLQSKYSPRGSRQAVWSLVTVAHLQV